MAKKVRFPLEMKDGVKVRSLHELTENFDLEKALEYAGNGKLETWLRDRMCAEMADEVQKLDVSDSKAGQKLCEIIFSVGSIAFEQDDLYDILEEGKDKIYLMGTEFEIPLEQKNVTYIGLNTPVILVNSKEIVNWEEKGIQIKDCVFDEAYRGLLEEEAKNASEARKYYEEMKKQKPEEVTHSYEELEKIAEERLAGVQEADETDADIDFDTSMEEDTSTEEAVEIFVYSHPEESILKEHYSDTGVYRLDGNKMNKIDVDLDCHTNHGHTNHYDYYGFGVLHSENKIYFASQLEDGDYIADEDDFSSVFDNNEEKLKEYNMDTGEIVDKYRYEAEIDALLCIRNNLLFTCNFHRRSGLHEHRIHTLDLRTLEEKVYKLSANNSDFDMASMFFVNSSGDKAYFFGGRTSVQEYDFKLDRTQTVMNIRDGYGSGFCVADDKLIGWYKDYDDKQCCSYMDLDSHQIFPCKEYNTDQYGPIGVTCADDTLYWVTVYNNYSDTYTVKISSIDLKNQKSRLLSKTEYGKRSKLDDILKVCNFIEVRSGYLYIYSRHYRGGLSRHERNRFPKIRLNLATCELEILKNWEFVTYRE
ncbi:MAG: hypothetical protein NC489_29635 [Ruminococcus flavefaciens]|nr:hypothetical protein [Ruminococcus flavefaciens]